MYSYLAMPQKSYIKSELLNTVQFDTCTLHFKHIFLNNLVIQSIYMVVRIIKQMNVNLKKNSALGLETKIGAYYMVLYG